MWRSSNSGTLILRTVPHHIQSVESLMVSFFDHAWKWEWFQRRYDAQYRMEEWDKTRAHARREALSLSEGLKELTTAAMEKADEQVQTEVWDRIQLSPKEDSGICIRAQS